MPSQIHLLDQLMLFFFALAATILVGAHRMASTQLLGRFAWTSSTICWAIGMILSVCQNFLLWEFRYSEFAETYTANIPTALLASFTLLLYIEGTRHRTHG